MELLTLIFIIFNVLLVIVHLKNLSKVIHIPGKLKQSLFNYFSTICVNLFFFKDCLILEGIFHLVPSIKNVAHKSS
jgi:hypothetical protein